MSDPHFFDPTDDTSNKVCRVAFYLQDRKPEEVSSPSAVAYSQPSIHSHSRISSTTKEEEEGGLNIQIPPKVLRKHRLNRADGREMKKRKMLSVDETRKKYGA